MTGKEKQAPTIVWVAVCLLAAGVGFYLGERQNAPFVGEHKSAPAKSGDVILTNHTISDIAKNAGRFVVTVETESPQANGGPDHVVPGLSPQSNTRGAGAGMIIRPDGYIVTSNHVLGVDKQVSIVLRDQTRLPAKTVGRDWFSDVAVLKVQAGDLPCAEFARDPHIEPGDWVVAIGTPMRLDHTISLGIVSAVGRTISDTSVPGTDLIQTDAAINPGNSGGPLLNIYGQVIGMNTAVHRAAQNISFAVPIEVVEQVSQTLINEGRVARGYLGLYMGSRPARNAPPPDNRQEGVYVILAVKNGPAAKAGLSAGDIIKSVNEQPVEDNGDVRRIITGLKPGSLVKMKVLHRGELEERSISLGQAPDLRAPGQLYR